MLRVDRQRSAADLLPAIHRVFELSAKKILALEQTWRPQDGSPVCTAAGRYQSRGWTEWTQGFQFGSPLLQFDATGDPDFLELGRARTVERMAPHLTHVGVHDHGFNIVSTYGNLWRVAREGKLQADAWEVRFYEMALKVSGAVQARRWTPLPDGGFIHSFNGAHSLFVDTIRTLRALALAHLLGHRLLEEQDATIDLLQRLREHALATATYSVYYGRARDSFDVRGRTAHESLFNTANGTYRGPSSQQGYSPFTTWTRGLAWAILGFAEQLEFLDAFTENVKMGSDPLYEAACATADYYIETAAASDGIPYWDTGAPGLQALGDWGARAADPFNDYEPVDSSAAAIAAQGFLRLARVASRRGHNGQRYEQAGLRVVDALIDDAGLYLSTDPSHQGLLLHSIYHRPNGWDYVPTGSRIPRGESSMWGDYHLREVALMIKRLAEGEPYLTFFAGGVPMSRVALITGGTRGIGLGIARALSQDGWKLALCGLRGRDAVVTVLDELRTSASAVEYWRADIGSSADRAALVGSVVSRFGTPDALVNNAGRAPRQRADLLEATEENFEEVMRTNLQGPYFLTQAVARLMASKPGANGAIVFVTSVSAGMASIDRGEYCVSKAGLSMAARLFALRLAPHGISVYEVRPGIIDTDMTAGVHDAYDRRIADGLIPDPRWGRPDDVGRAVASLLRGDVPYATGTIINVDGGLSIPRL